MKNWKNYPVARNNWRQRNQKKNWVNKIFSLWYTTSNWTCNYFSVTHTIIETKKTDIVHEKRTGKKNKINTEFYLNFIKNTQKIFHIAVEDYETVSRVNNEAMVKPIKPNKVDTSAVETVSKLVQEQNKSQFISEDDLNSTKKFSLIEGTRSHF